MHRYLQWVIVVYRDLLFWYFIFGSQPRRLFLIIVSVVGGFRHMHQPRVVNHAPSALDRPHYDIACNAMLRQRLIARHTLVPPPLASVGRLVPSTGRRFDRYLQEPKMPVGPSLHHGHALNSYYVMKILAWRLRICRIVQQHVASYTHTYIHTCTNTRHSVSISYLLCNSD
jgi:hypothetical protein